MRQMWIIQIRGACIFIRVFGGWSAPGLLSVEVDVVGGRGFNGALSIPSFS